MEKTPIRRAFFSRLEGMLYGYLKTYPLLSDWNPQELYQLARGIIHTREAEIIAYLDANNFELKETDKVVGSIMEKFLLPAVQKIRI